MKKILIFGNSGSGKSTLAKHLKKSAGLAHLDLDTLAWEQTTPPQRKTLEDSWKQINQFITLNTSWVIEGCYTDLLALIKAYSSEIIFMNLPVEACISNAKIRPWEPHKYDSKEAQDKNLVMLIKWIEAYPQRNDTFSESAHKKFYEEFIGKKRMITANEKYI